jgi:hypothetical protein
MYMNPWKDAVSEIGQDVAIHLGTKELPERGDYRTWMDPYLDENLHET